MELLAVDMDGVLANVYSQFISMHAEEFGVILGPDEIIGRPEPEVFPNGRVYVNTPGFFLNAPVVEGGQEILRQLNKRYHVYIVSAAMEFPLSLWEKQAWLGEHFPFITWKQIVFCGSKEIIHADIMIDDQFRNLDNFHGKTYLFTEPHNQLADPGRHIRVNSWEDVELHLLKRQKLK